MGTTKVVVQQANSSYLAPLFKFLNYHNVVENTKILLCNRILTMDAFSNIPDHQKGDFMRHLEDQQMKDSLKWAFLQNECHTKFEHNVVLYVLCYV